MNFVFIYLNELFKLSKFGPFEMHTRFHGPLEYKGPLKNIDASAVEILKKSLLLRQIEEFKTVYISPDRSLEQRKQHR